MTTQELNALGWNIYRSNNWIARHRETGKKITAGTLSTLLQLVKYEEWQNAQPWSTLLETNK